ncbi:MAG: NADH-quinone oxidoreductase subunit G [Coxiella sp. RIFCSPHIGHO2_12_FULL_42_15]|nr:MAG: NADH-quinone oxidoreductase subunit G [Coxiella sp. RIFCSPHIGHO2_12_FULL_42_15]
MVKIEIDGQELSVIEGATIIEVADEAGIYIPRFCYHKNLSIAANCRMCLVEVEKVGKPLPACATTITEGMKVFTRSKKALEAQRSVMEFLLINHPLDCPICDQGGECELQDLSMGFGRADSHYDEPKRSVASENMGPLIETWMTRCIHCTRCVRFGEEIAGLRELGATGRGEHMEIGTYVQHFLKSELSGNIIDLCPVGALTNKPARYAGRGWEYHEHATIAPHDGVGSHLFVHSRGRILQPQRFVMRTVPRECAAINETWISDRDRFSVHAIYHPSRVKKPMVNRNGEWVELEWQRAIDEIVDRTRAIQQQFSGDEIAALASPNSTIEELYLLQKLMRALGSPHIDHRLRQHDFSDQARFAADPKINISIADMETLDTIVLIGSNVRYEQPLVAHRINKASGEGATVIAINPVDYAFTFPVTDKFIVPPQQMVTALAKIAKALADQAQASMAELSDVKPCDTGRRIAKTLASHKKVALFLGEHALNHPAAAAIRYYAHLIARLSQASVNLLTEGANTSGAWLAGCVPHRGPALQKVEREGRTAKELLTNKPVRAYFLLNTEPEYDSAFPETALKVLHHAGLVVCLTPFVSDMMRDYADFILPIAPFTETAGTFVNLEGRWQSFAAASEPHDDHKPAWKVLRVLANFFEVDGFHYKTVHEVQAEIKQAVEAMQAMAYVPEAITPHHEPHEALYRLAAWPMYRCDSLVRRSEPLQKTMEKEDRAMALNQKTATALNFKAGDWIRAQQQDHCIELPLVINDRLTDNTVWLPAGLEETAGFGSTEMPIRLTRGPSS